MKYKEDTKTSNRLRENIDKPHILQGLLSRKYGNSEKLKVEKPNNTFRKWEKDQGGCTDGK